MLTTVLDSYRRHRFACLFFSLLLTLGAHPVFKALVASFNPLELLLAVNLVAAIASAAHERWISGQMSPRAKQEFAANGWTIREGKDL